MSILFEILTIDDVQNDASDIYLYQFTLLRYISVVSFINIAFVVVKLKIFKIFHIDSAAMKWSLFRGGFGPY